MTEAKKVDFDRILEKIGGLGYYQICMYILLGLTGIHVGMHTLLGVFSLGIPDHWCNVKQLANESKHVQLGIGIPLQSDKTSVQQYSQCHMYDIDYAAINISLYLASNGTSTIDNTTAVKQCHSWNYDHSVFGKNAVSQWNLVCDDSWMRALTQSIYMLGVLLGAIIFGSLSDIIGRKKSTLMGIGLTVVAGFGAAFTPEYWSYACFRCLQGVGAIGGYTCAFVHAMEIIGPEYRMVPGIMFQCWFTLGYMLMVPLAYVVPDQSNLLLIISIYPIVFFSYIWILGDSPRWLLTQGKKEEAEKEIRKASKMNKAAYPADLVQLETKELLNISEIEHHGQGQVYTVLDVLKRPNMRKRAINVFFNWFVNSFVYYGLSLGGSHLAASPHMNLLIGGVAEIIGLSIAALTLNRFGRRIPIAVLMVIGGVACIANAAVPREMVIARNVLAMIGKLGISGSFGSIYVYTAELFPTVVRTASVGAGSMHARAGALVAPFVAMLGPIAWGPLPILMFGGSSVAAGLLVLLLPETLHKHLPETLEDGENFGLKRDLVDTKHTANGFHTDI